MLPMVNVTDAYPSSCIGLRSALTGGPFVVSTLGKAKKDITTANMTPAWISFKKDQTLEGIDGKIPEEG
jgi:hypothetical protein